MKKIIILFFVCLSWTAFAADSIKEPSDIDEPVFKDKYKEDPLLHAYKVAFQYQSGTFLKGKVPQFDNKSFEVVTGDTVEVSREIYFTSVKTVRIKGYTMQKKTQDNLSIVFYFPYVYDIELTSGEKIVDAKGRIKELESFYLHAADTKKKFYSYFIRYWLEDTKMFSDTLSSDYNENPKVPDNVVIYLEFKSNKK